MKYEKLKFPPSFPDPSDTIKPRNGCVQLSNDPRDSSAGWTCGPVGPSPSASSSSTPPPPHQLPMSSVSGTLRRGTSMAANNEQHDRRSPDVHRWDDVSPKPFSYLGHNHPPPQLVLRHDPSELNGAAIKEKLMMSSSHIPESCV